MRRDGSQVIFGLRLHEDLVVQSCGDSAEVFGPVIMLVPTK